jgi:MraZ protein
MLAGAMDVNLDKQGRMIMPDYLKAFAGLNKKVILAGLYNRLEVWDEKAWSKYQVTTDKDSNDIAEGLVDLGI